MNERERRDKGHGLVKSERSQGSPMVAHNRSSEVIPSLYPLSSPPMSDSLSAPPRPSVFPTPSRNPPGPPSSRSVATLLASRGNGATPIPASLQEKMAAVCTLPI